MRSLFMVFGLLLAAAVQAAPVKVVRLIYQVAEPDVDSPYVTRILVSPQYVRMDDGKDAGDFLLFDRKAKVIDSVTHDDRTIFEIPYRPVRVKSPLTLKVEDQTVTDSAPLPPIDGKTPRHFRLQANGEVCYDLIAVPGMYPDVLAALTAYRTNLAGEHAKTLPNIPRDQLEPCDLAFNTFRSGWLYSHGLPVELWDSAGNRRHLSDFGRDVEVDSSLFVLPKDYQRYTSDQ